MLESLLELITVQDESSFSDLPSLDELKMEEDGNTDLPVLGTIRQEISKNCFLG